MAERTLRPAVIYRKLSFGTQSASCSRFPERLLSVSETFLQQVGNTYEYLVDAIQASFAGPPFPTLPPVETRPDAAAKTA